MTPNEKLTRISKRLHDGQIRIMIIGLGSVGNYLLTYLLSRNDPRIELVVAGRNADKMKSDVNIATVSALIRQQCKSKVSIAGGIDLESPDSIAQCLEEYQPDIIVNSSRVYSGLKYGSISWSNVRAYGIWTPLSIRYIRNVMLGCQQAHCEAIVINTSYSDGTIPWLKSAGIPYPDFGSGNLNHIVPRLRLAAAGMLDIDDFWNIDVELATAHFHDVVISKEGHNEGIKQLSRISYKGRIINLDEDLLLKECAIPMPVDQKRNMMNASSNYNLIDTIIKACNGGKGKVFSPGAFGEIGGYPVVIDGTGNEVNAYIDESAFSLDAMRISNRKSIYLDGIEDIRDGRLVYTDELIRKTRAAFGAKLPKVVSYEEIDATADWIIENIIKPNLKNS